VRCHGDVFFESLVALFAGAPILNRIQPTA
jgi:hypothetical protein